MFQPLRERLHRYKKWEPLVFFIAGFSFDALLLHRIDDPWMLGHQALYLSLAAFLIAWDLWCESGKAEIPRFLQKIWAYREGFLHFLLGTLLNVYTIFYFKSGSIQGSLIFLVLLSILLVLNEVRPSRISKHLLRNSLFSLCLVSYMNIVASILLGSIGLWVFMCGILAATLVHVLFVHGLTRRLAGPLIWRDIRLPFVGVVAIYSLLFVLKVLPPVPLSVKSIGIYREVTKEDGIYKLGFERPLWRFWENGDQTFYARPGDKIYCFARIFSPANFKEQLYVRWQYKELGHWQSWDAIPFNIVGGREEGFRGYTVKTNYIPGSWRVSIETRDGRELGRTRFDVVATDASPDPVVLNYQRL